MPREKDDGDKSTDHNVLSSDSDKANSLNVLMALLDFDSDRATAHASFVVASIFGIYAVLFSFNSFNGFWGNIVFILTYVSLTFISVYSFLNFSNYASRANAAQNTIEQVYFKSEEIKKYYYEIRDRESESKFLAFFQRKLLGWKATPKIKAFIFLWGVSVALPFLWIIREFILDLILWITNLL